MVNPKKRFVRLIAMVAFAAIVIMFSCIAEAKDLGKDKQQIAFNDSLQYVLKNAQVSAWTQSVLSYKVITAKMFKPVERQSASGVKAKMWPFKVEGSGVVLSSVDMGMIKNQQKYAVTVSYTAYAFYNELEEFKVEIGESKILSNRQITDDSNSPEIQTQDYTSKFLELKKACELGNDDACISVRGSKGYDDSINEYGYYMLLGSRYNYRKNFDDAIKIYDLAIKLKPNEIGAFRDRSAIYIKTKQYKKAFDDADRVKKFNPQGGLYLRSRVLWHQGKTDSSIKEMNKCCKIKHSSECDDLSEANLSKLFDLN